MIVYHIDRTLLLSINQTISTIDNYDLEKIFNIYGNSLSAHGIQYLTKSLNNNIQSFLWEIALEYVRLIKYPQYPSRFKCLFAVESLEQLEKWKEHMNGQAYKIVKLECSKTYKFDSNWITNPATLSNYYKTNKFEDISFSYYCYFADKYWSMEVSPNPLWELLIEFPCRCIEIISD